MTSLLCLLLSLPGLFLQHDRDLRQAVASTTSLAFKFALDAPVARKLMSATRVWQTQHTPRKPHPMGSCGTAVGTVLLKELLSHGLHQHKDRDHILWNTLDTLLGKYTPQLIAREVTFCSAKMNAKKTACILVLQIHSALILHSAHPMLRSSLAKTSAPLTFLSTLGDANKT